MNISIERKKWNTKKEMKDYVKSSGRGSIIEKDDDGTKEDYESLDIAISSGSEFRIGLVYYPHGVQAQFVCNEKESLVFIGIDQLLVLIDIGSGRVKNTHNLFSVFDGFVAAEWFPHVIAYTDTHLIIIDWSGNIRKETSFSDSIYEIYLEGERLVVKLSDDSMQCLNLQEYEAWKANYEA